MPRTPSIELPARLIAAARRVLERDGIVAVTHRAVAAEAGASVNSIANRFGSRAELLDDLAHSGFIELASHLMDLDGHPLPDIGDPRRALLEAERRYHGWADGNPELYRFDVQRTDGRANPVGGRPGGLRTGRSVSCGWWRSGPVSMRRRGSLRCNGAIALDGAGLGWRPSPGAGGRFEGPVAVMGTMRAMANHGAGHRTGHRP